MKNTDKELTIKHGFVYLKKDNVEYHVLNIDFGDFSNVQLHVIPYGKILECSKLHEVQEKDVEKIALKSLPLEFLNALAYFFSHSTSEDLFAFEIQN